MNSVPFNDYYLIYETILTTYSQLTTINWRGHALRQQCNATTLYQPNRTNYKTKN